MALDTRLACLRAAILEDWAELEAEEIDGMLVIRVRERVKVNEILDEWMPRYSGRHASRRAPE